MAQRGFAANAHGIVRDDKGIIWFNANTGRGSLGRIDPKTEKIDVFVPPQGMSPTGGAVTLDTDRKGKVWVTSPDGALRFDPETEKFTEFKSPTFKDRQTAPTARPTALPPIGTATAGGCRWRTISSTRPIPRPARSATSSFPPIKPEIDRINDPEMVKFYENFAPLDFNTPVPWNQGPRRMGADKTPDEVWVGTSWGASLIRINAKTMESSVVPLALSGHVALSDHGRQGP